MASTYSSRHSKPLGLDANAWAGAGRNMGIEALAGDTDLVTIFDDFNGIVTNESGAGTAQWETMGWVLTGIGTQTAAEYGMNDIDDVSEGFVSCIRLNPGTVDDAGVNLQLDRIVATTPVASGGLNFPHIWIPQNTTATILDNTVVVFACRVGFIPEAATGNWNAKAFIGWAETADIGIMTAATGAIVIASTGPLVGFHFPEDGSIDGISHRTVATAMAEGTNFTELLRAGTLDSTLANGAVTIGDPMWFDLALRMTITDMSDVNANGATEFFSRRVSPVTGATGNRDDELPGQGSAWTKHPTVLLNQTPNNNLALVPTIEMLNGPAGNEGDMLIDWWSMGISRFSRR